MLALLDLVRVDGLRAEARALVEECARLAREREAAGGDGAPRGEMVVRLNPRYLAALARPKSKPAERYRACVNLVDCGELGRALFHATDLLGDEKLKPKIEALIGQCRAMRRLRLHSRATEGWPEGAEVADGYAAIPAGSDTTVLCFTGKGSIFGISSYFLRGLLEMHRVNTVFLFDWDEVGYLAGISGLGRSFEESVENLAALCRKLGTRRLVTLGVSLGGYGAMRYGLALGADATLTLAPRLRGVLREKHLKEISAAVGRELSPAEIDIRRLYAAEARTPLTWMVYGADHESDALCAAHMRGLPGIVEEPLRGVSDHRVLTRLAVSGEFTPLFGRFLEAVGPGVWSRDPVEA
jgi:pimeloyl-ACP methyl ester carboxylesterase